MKLDLNVERRKGEQGFVLVNALIIVAALSSVTLQVLRETTHGIKRVEALRDISQTELLADGGVSLAERLLKEDFRGVPLDHRGEAWALSSFRAQAGGGTLVVSVVDLQDKLNINLLSEGSQDTLPNAFSELASSAGLTETETRAIIIKFGSDPNSPDDPTSVSADGPDSALSGTSDVANLAELAMIEGISQKTIARLDGFAVALPPDAGINVNTANAKLLAAVLGVADVEILSSALEDRAAIPFATVDDFAALIANEIDGDAAAKVREGLFDVGSEWFEVTSVAEFGGIQRTYRTVLYRHSETGLVTRMASFPGSER